METLKCKKCGSKEFTADIIYNAGVELYENGDWNITSDLEAEEIDKGSVQCLQCGEDVEMRTIVNINE
jgi:predicted nucleic-acid-binding Zn-ribbon protein